MGLKAAKVLKEMITQETLHPKMKNESFSLKIFQNI